tara:strand:+ start:666 stop:1022 length:357 start_codon:yes stop_codon:yes gene_type:complete
MSQYEDFTFDQGADQSIKLELVNTDGTKKNLAGFTANAQIRKSYSSSDSDAITFSTQFESPVSTGVLNLTLTNTQTSAMKSGRYVYDVEISSQDSASNTIIERILEGQITVSPSVTRT